VQLIVGPPASGKTTRLLEVAGEFLRQRKRVWWIALPSQRAYVYRRATEKGAILGLEVLTSQQLYYRILAASFGLRPILTGPGRVALAGEALISGDGPLPSPGEARLFARAIAEAKRNGVKPAEVPPISTEARRLQHVYARYEELKGYWGRWDYDDFRSAASELLESGQAKIEADLVIVDGFRELSVLELQVLQALSRRIPVWVGLPEVPPGFSADQTLVPRFIHNQTYRAQNPVSEARWVLRSIKRDLALGISPLEIAVLSPESRIPALLTLADEYGIPLVDQTANTAAETPEGRLLLELLDLPDHPTPTELLAVPDLAPLGRIALERTLVGREAITRLAGEIGMGDVWAAWLERLEPKGNGLEWATELLDSLPEVRHSPRRATLMERAREAHRIATGPDFRHWWAALLAETYEPHRPPGGVALLTPTLASGQRWKKLYLTYAVEGAYGTGEREDYFIPEELRVSLEEVIKQVLAKNRPAAVPEISPGGRMAVRPYNRSEGEIHDSVKQRSASFPRRFLGRDRLLLSELKTRAEEVIVTYPEASQEGPLEPEPALVQGKPTYLPKLPPGSALEIVQSTRYQAPLSLAILGKATLEALRRYSDCSLRYWAEELLPYQDEEAWWTALVRELRKAEKLVPARLEILCRQFPLAEGWLRHYQTELNGLNLGFRLEGMGMEAQMDAVRRSGSEAHLYRFTEPDLHPEDAEQLVRGRWSERWAAAYLLESFKGRIQKVYLWAWPMLGEPVLVYDKPIEKVWVALENLVTKAKEAHSRYKAGVVEPNPGFRCRDCRVSDICREGRIS